MTKSTNHQTCIFRNAVIIAVILAATSVMFSACSADKGSGSSTIARDNTAQKELPETTLKSAYGAFREILEENEAAIHGYGWQKDLEYNNCITGDYIFRPEVFENLTKDEITNRCVTIADLDGDGIPEMMFMAADESADSYVARLHIFRYDAATGKASEIKYQFSPSDDGSLVSWTKNAFMIYTGKEEGTFYMVYAFADIDSDYCISKFRMLENGVIEEARSIENIRTCNWVSDQDITTEETYDVNGREVSPADGLKARTEAESDYNKLLMYSGNLSLGEERTSFSNISSDDESEAVSYNTASDWLKAKCHV